MICKKTTELAQKGQSMVLGIQTIETGVFGGIVTGILTAYLHNKFNKIELPAYLRLLQWFSFCTYYYCS